MSTHEDLSVLYHQQDTGDYCGAACAQMVLNFVGAQLLDQDNLYQTIHPRNTAEGGWSSAPDGLQWTMSTLDPASHAFTLAALNTEDAISRKIVWAIHSHQIPPIALVHGSIHWLVVRGYTATNAPANAADTSFTIQSFDVNDPWPPAPSFYKFPGVPQVPPPHGDEDGCGSGIILSSGLSRGDADHNISYSCWKSQYMTGVERGFWTGKFIAITDPDSPFGPPTGIRVEERVEERVNMKNYSRQRLLTAAQAIARAYEGLKRYGLAERRNYAVVLRRARAGSPLLVQHLDHLDSFYYIVPIGEKAQEKGVMAPLVVAVDAYTGDYLRSAVRSAESTHVFFLVNRKAASARLIGQRIELPNKLGRLLVREEAGSLYQNLVWRPCQESLSPFYPFYQYNLGDHRIYVRSDGSVFTQLHTDVRGV